MKKGKILVIANWKMNPASLAEAKTLFSAVSRTTVRLRNIKAVLCPPTVFLSVFSGKKNLGAQNVFWQNGGRNTGEVSPEMLKSISVSHVIVGHSERRALGETDEIVSKKVQAVAREGLTAVLCVGEHERDTNGAYFEFLRNQIKQSLAGVQRRFASSLVIAYEPIWAVGKSFRDAMGGSDIHETVIFIQKVLSDMYDQPTALSIPVLYGGAVELENISEILKAGGVSGVLVGHKSLIEEDFTAILKSADAI